MYRLSLLIPLTFASKLSTNLFYKSIFVIDYNYIFFFFFFTVKLSIFSRFCVKQKNDEQVNTLKYRNSILILKKTAVSDRYRQILRIIGIGSVLKKWYRASPTSNELVC